MAAARRGTSWFDTEINSQAVSGTAGTPITLLPADVEVRDVPGLTIIRMLIELNCHAVVPNVVEGGQALHLAAGLVMTDGFVSGALPDLLSPSEEPIRGWIFKNMRFIYDSEGTISPWSGSDLFLDIKSQRKLDLDTEVYFQMFNQAMTGTAFTVEVTGLIRTLVKLP